jgi:hypothetical protein
MRSNYTQILQKTIKVAETTDAVATYGRAKETAYQLAKAAAEVKRDLEVDLPEQRHEGRGLQLGCRDVRLVSGPG